jgi:hypothetical protein
MGAYGRSFSVRQSYRRLCDTLVGLLLRRLVSTLIAVVPLRCAA